MSPFSQCRFQFALFWAQWCMKLGLELNALQMRRAQQIDEVLRIWDSRQKTRPVSESDSERWENVKIGTIAFCVVQPVLLADKDSDDKKFEVIVTVRYELNVLGIQSKTASFVLLWTENFGSWESVQLNREQLKLFQAFSYMSTIWNQIERSFWTKNQFFQVYTY